MQERLAKTYSPARKPKRIKKMFAFMRANVFWTKEELLAATAPADRRVIEITINTLAAEGRLSTKTGKYRLKGVI